MNIMKIVTNFFTFSIISLFLFTQANAQTATITVSPNTIYVPVTGTITANITATCSGVCTGVGFQALLNGDITEIFGACGDSGAACSGTITISHTGQGGTLTVPYVASGGLTLSVAVIIGDGSALADISTSTIVFPAAPPLPVELVSFTAKVKNQDINLAWKTASETNNDGFYVEQSINGKEWKSLDFVKGKGTTNTTTSYSFEHATPSVGVNYYRLKQMDYDGKSEYSPVQSVVIGGKGFAIKTTLVKESLIVTTNDDNPVSLSIYNTAGQQVVGNKIIQGEQTINISHLQNGLYIIRSVTGEVGRFTKF